MMKISAVIIAKNEEEMIADCIDSVGFCDEIIIIDSHSVDRTVEIAERMHAKVYQSESDSFADRRMLGMQKAKGNWILYIDADERLDETLVSSIKNLVLNMQEEKYAAFRIKRKNYYLGNHEWPTVESLERLFKKRDLKGWRGELHESPEVDGEIGDIEGYLKHYTHRNLTSMLNKTIIWSGVEAKLRYDAHHPPVVWWRIPRVMLTAFYDSYIKQKGYSIGVVGLIESIYQAFSMFITYARLWEMQNQPKKVEN